MTTEYAEEAPEPHPGRDGSSASDSAAAELSRLFAAIERDQRAHVGAFQAILDHHAGRELADGQRLREFKAEFKRVCERLGVGIELPGGGRGTLQVVNRPDGRVWTAVYRGHLQVYKCPVPDNTIPELRIG